LKINKNHVYKIRRLIQNEKILYFYAEVDRNLSNNKKIFYQSIVKQGFNCYNLQYSSAKNLLEETLFKNYGFLLKDSFYVVKPNNVKFETIEKTFSNKARLIGVKLNNKIYLENAHVTPSSFCYEKELLLLTSFLCNCLNSISSLHRNNVN
jgi:competence CoiA-like predicted nuclease